ncbi:MAG: hypothetical protein P4L79_09435 [Legionella sp.]|uniref:FAD-dependent oxidoreductase n=1 Tax=Legionella sp. TaxID=459 RepID=UPI002845DE9B|nr:hypothetical protein [Legionella sp.]
MKNIVIAGAGPVGLYAAIRLKKQYGADVNVVVVDPYLDSYDRPGIIAKMAVEIINKSLGAAGVKPIAVPESGGYPPNSVFIKDLQGVLLADAKDLGIKFEQGSFVRAEAANVVVTSKGAGGIVAPKSLPCDLLLDCSGERRVVATQVNIDKPGTFTVKPIADNPVKKHFVAYVQMDAENAAKCSLNEARELEPLAFAVNMEALRKTHGWAHHALPQVTPASWELPGGRKRFCFYFEIPDRLHGPEVPKEAQVAYLSALLKLKTGKDIDFVAEAGRGHFTSFEVDPKIVADPINTTAYSYPIALCGDAHMSPEYRLGTGVRNGIECANVLMEMTRLRGDFEIAKEGYDMYAQRVIAPHEKAVVGEYGPKKTALKTTDIYLACEKYCQAYDKAAAKPDEAAKAIISAGLKDLFQIIKASADERLKQAIAAKPKEKEEASYPRNLRDAEREYMHALDLCSRLPEGPERRDQEARILLNLARVNTKLGEFDRALGWASNAFVASNTHRVAEMIPKAENLLYECLGNKYTADVAKLPKVGAGERANILREAFADELLKLSNVATTPAFAHKCLKEALGHYQFLTSPSALEKSIVIYERLIKIEKPTSEADSASAARMHEYETDLGIARASLVKLRLGQEKAQSQAPGPTPPAPGDDNKFGLQH